MFKKHRPPQGSQPGTLITDADASAPRLHVIHYSGEEFEEAELEPSQVQTITSMRGGKGVTWVDIQGLANLELLQNVAEQFSIHPLALEDVTHIPQRPKAEEFDNSIFIITYMISAKELPEIDVEQVSLFLGPDYVVTFQERHGDVLEPIRTRLRQNKGPIRKNGSDYLAYAILDAVIDAYYPVLEVLGEYLEDLESEVIENPNEESLQRVYQVRREMLALRRSIFPQREVLSSLIRDGSKLFKKTTTVYLRDCYDHCAQIIEVLETYREICGSLMDVYLSGLSNKMNEVMKVLTVISTIFIPLSFLAGVYGMNFQHMPELKETWAYPTFWCIAISIAVGMLFYFRRLGWIGGSSNTQPQGK